MPTSSFSCIIPVFSNELVSSLPGNTIHIINKLGGSILSSVYNTYKGAFHNGFLVQNENCNWKNIKYTLAKISNDLSVLDRECEGFKIPISNIISGNNNEKVVILNQPVNPQNGTVKIWDQVYQGINDNIFSSNNVTSFLGLKECTVEAAVNTLNEYYDYLLSLISTTTTELPTTTESLLNILKGAFNISSDVISINDMNKCLSELYNPTIENPNDNMNDAANTNIYIAAGVAGSIALIIGGVIVGYIIGGKNKKVAALDCEEGTNQMNEALEKDLVLVINNIKCLENNNLNDSRNYEEIHDEGLLLLNEIMNYDKFSKNTGKLFKILSDVDRLINDDQSSNNKLEKNIYQSILQKLKKTISNLVEIIKDDHNIVDAHFYEQNMLNLYNCFKDSETSNDFQDLETIGNNAL